MKTIAQIMMYDNIDNTMGLYAEMIYEDAKNHKVNKSGVEALETLIRAWATLHITTNACKGTEKISALTGNTPRSPELPFEFPTPKKVDAL